MELNNPNSDVVVLVGGGFAGLTTAMKLSASKNRPKIILIEPKDRFVFSPFLYELLSGELELWEIAPTYKSLVAEKGIILIQESVRTIDAFEQKVITMSGLEIKYSKVVLATGSKPNDFGIPGVSDHALMFHSLLDIKLLKQLLNELSNCNEAMNQLVIVGAGATGVELACKISDLVPDNIQIHLVEMGTSVLPHGKYFNKEQSEYALNSRGIRLHLQTQVIAISSNEVELESLVNNHSSRFSLPHRGLIWTAGFKAVYPEIIPQPTLIDDRISIDSYLNVRGMDNVLALGDISCDKKISSHPVSAQLAMQQGVIAANNLIAFTEGKSQKLFKYKDFGEMLSLGIGEGSITALGLTIAGPIAFQLRRMSYLTKIPNFSLGFRSAISWFLSPLKR
tara:strand:+ start:3097 stop:4278 length:1182 start_codon:yes stop_codon:yes gene_type:complete